MLLFRQFPLLRPLSFFIAGIVWQINWPSGVQYALAVFIASLLFTFVSVYVKRIGKSWRHRWIYGFFMCMIFYAFGIIITWVNTNENFPTDISRFGDSQKIICRINDQLHEKENSFRTTVVVHGVQINDQWKNASGNFILNFYKSEKSRSLKYGDVLCLNSKLNPVQEPANPGEFNYKRFLRFHNISRQSFVRDDGFILLKEKQGNLFRSYAFEMRDKMVETFRDYIKSEREYAVASALLVGQEDYIDDDLESAYASAGALHVLSVSGMHVGIIFVVFSGLLKWMNRKGLLWHLKHIILILFVWSYAMLTGFSPSVLRASSMLTFIIVGLWLRKNYEMGNSVCVAALFLLLNNPYMITEVGFQLSFLAVFGIFVIHPLIYWLWTAPNLFLHKVWELISVSISAQLMTFPLGLLYFHQFPNLFVISNLFVIPLATIIIYSCIVLQILSVFIIVSKYFVVWCFGLLYILNKVVLAVEAIPFSITSGISISVFETWMVYFCIAFLIFYMTKKHFVYLKGLLICLLIFSVSRLIYEYRVTSQSRIIVYSVKQESAMDFISGREHFFSASGRLLQNKSSMLFHIIHNWWECGLNDFSGPESAAQRSSSFFFARNQFYGFKDKRIKILDQKVDRKLLYHFKDKPLKIDFLVLSGNVYQDISVLKKIFDFRQIIIDSSYSNYRAEKIRKNCEQEGIPCYAVTGNKAWVAEI